MGDQLRWWKLWITALDDPALANLSMEDCWRWAVLGALLRAHGEGGTGTWPRPGRALVKAWRTTWPYLPQIARRLPGVTVDVTEDAITLTMRNWHKYQEDSSTERTRAWRERQRQRDAQLPSPVTISSVTCDGADETRRDETEQKNRSRLGGYVDNSTPRPPTDPPPAGLLPQSPRQPKLGARSLPRVPLPTTASATTRTAAERVAELRAAEPKPPASHDEEQPAW